MVASALAVAGDREERGRHRPGRHHARRVGDGLRVDPLLEPYGEVLRVVSNSRIGRVLELQPEYQRVLDLEAPNVPHPHGEVVVVVGYFGRSVEHARQRVRPLLRQQRILLRPVQQRKQPLRRNRAPPAFLPYPAFPKERESVKRLLGSREMQDMGLPLEDDRQIILGIRSQRPNREVEIPRRERDQELRIRLLLHRHRPSVEPRHLPREHDRCRARLRCGRNLGDDELIKRSLGDRSGVERQWK